MNSRVIIFVALFALCASYANAQSGTTWALCANTPAGHLNVTSVSLSPDPPVRGTDDIVTLTGIVDEAVTGGTITLTIVYVPLNLQVYSNTYQVCSSIDCTSTNPSVSASLTVSGSAIPSFSPPGQYTGTATMVDQNGASLACVTVTFTLN